MPSWKGIAWDAVEFSIDIQSQNVIAMCWCSVGYNVGKVGAVRAAIHAALIKNHNPPITASTYNNCN